MRRRQILQQKAQEEAEPTGAKCPTCGRRFKKPFVPFFHAVKCGKE